MSHTLVCAATSYEIAPFLQYLENEGQKKNFSTYMLGGLELQLLITGVGPVLTAHGLAKYFNLQKPALAIHAGVAGGRESLEIGQVVQPVKDRYADLGAENVDGFMDVFDLELANPDMFPFLDGWIHPPDNGFLLNDSVPKVKGITVSTVTGSIDTKKQWESKYNPDIETMEGASFFYACLMDHIDFISIRAISNHIGVRDKNFWNLPKAIENLNAALIELVQTV